MTDFVGEIMLLPLRLVVFITFMSYNRLPVLTGVLIDALSYSYIDLLFSLSWTMVTLFMVLLSLPFEIPSHCSSLKCSVCTEAFKFPCTLPPHRKWLACLAQSQNIGNHDLSTLISVHYYCL